VWPTIAAPFVLLVQLLQVRSSPAANAVPSDCVPVKMSCRLGVSPRPLMISPFSEIKFETALDELRARLALCRLQQRADGYGFSDESIDLADLSLGDLTPPLRRRPVWRTIQQKPYLVDLETYEFGEANDGQSLQHANVIAPLPTLAWRLRQEP
jgi:hypothetical protein